MRRSIYKTMLAAPFRVSGAAIGIAGFVGSVWPEKVKSVIGGGEATIQGFGIALLAASTLYFLLLWLLKPGESEPSAPAPATGPQTTLGHGSPNIGNARDVHIYPPAAEHPRKQAKRAPEVMEQQVARLARATEGYPAGLATYRAGPKVPDFTLLDLARRLIDLKGPSPENDSDKREFYRRINLEIADKVRFNHLTVWARYADFALKEIDHDDWDHAIVDVVADVLRIPNDWNTLTYTDVQFVKAEIDRVWPAKIEAAPQSLSEETARPAKAEEEKFADPYRQAVLHLKEPKVTKLAGSGGPGITSVECDLIIEGKAVLQKCSVWLGELRSNGSAELIDARVRTGRQNGEAYPNLFATHSVGKIARLRLINRDLTDVVSNPPFLILTDRGNFPLEDNTVYSLDIELHSEAKYPTKATLTITTGVKDELSASIERQTV